VVVRNVVHEWNEINYCNLILICECMALNQILYVCIYIYIYIYKRWVVLYPHARVRAHSQEGENECRGSVFLFFRHVQTPNLLVLDCCEPHTDESIVTEFYSHQSNRLIIPGGCTSKLQPLDISLKSMFHVSGYITLQPATVFEFPI
jgi:hypothetical protein